MRTTMMFAALAATLCLAGCAMESTRVAQAPTEDPPLKGYDAEIDWAYVAKVNKIAARRGVKIMWIHYPARRQEVSQNR